MSKKNIYIACGGSGGHVIPGLGICNLLAKLPHVNIILIGVKRKENKFLFDNYMSNTCFKNIQHFYLPDVRLRNFAWFKPLNVLVYMIKLFLIMSWIGWVFWNKKPSIVIGFGSYAAFPIVFIATFFKSAFTIIHEQNLKFGKANQILIPLVDKITVSFQDTLTTLKKFNQDYKIGIYSKLFYLIKKKADIEEKIVVTGNPSVMKENSFHPTQRPDVEGKTSINLLIMGGSQGSDFLNYVVPKALRKVKKTLLDRIKVLHIIGNRKKPEVKQEYEDAAINYNLINFSFNMNHIYKETDLVICRAGATTLSELIFYKLPAILLPFEFVKGHQLNNALFFKRLKLAIVLKKNECTKDKLKYNIERLLIDVPLRREIIKNLTDFGSIDTNKKFMEVIQEAGIC